jgi:hypothetical protein
MDKGLCYSDADFPIEAVKFCSEIQSAARAVTGSLQSMNPDCLPPREIGTSISGRAKTKR